MSEFYKLSVDETLQELDVNVEAGLSTTEVSSRQTKYGKNELPTDEGIDLLKLVISQFTDLMVLILLFAAGVSLFLGDVKDVIVIMVIVVLNAMLGIYQEYQAEQSLAALSAMQVPKVRVRRDGKLQEVDAEDLVPGDIVILEEGDRIPADGRLIESINMQVEEAALTGESQAVEKNTAPIVTEKDVALGDRSNLVFMGTTVNYGRGQMVVTNTGLKTELGNIAALLLQVETGVTPLQRRMTQLGRTLAIGAAIVVALVFVAGLIRGLPPEDMFLVAISLAVAAVPEGLPALITIGLSLGASRMVRRNALIRRLPAVETLGSVNIICSDKTGTLTKNEMTATQIALPGHDDVMVTGIGYTPKGEFFLENGDALNPTADPAVARFLKAMALSTNATLTEDQETHKINVIGDTTEGAMVVAAQKVGWTRPQLEEDLPRVAELPFSSERKAMTTAHKVAGDNAKELFGDGYITITKGAPDRLINWANREHIPSGLRDLTEERRALWQSQVDEMASEGLRVLGVAYRPFAEQPEEITQETERELALLGLVGIVDPARTEAKEAVAVARKAGVRSMMITGDHALTAEAIARNLGILQEGEHAITGTQLDMMDDTQLLKELETTSAFARVSPEHKLRIVKVLKDSGQIVAMTGDGVNDAPALKQADIGVAMGITGTDVSKGAAEMVLTDDNFASIVSAVEEGRTIYDNIRKFIKYLLSSNVGEILVMFTALMIGLKIPLLAIQILWINLVTDGLPAIALGFGEPEPGVMDRKPRPVNESIFAGGTGSHIVFIGILIAILTLGGFIFGFLNHDMKPFESSLGLEEFTYAELIEIADEDHVPANWDELTIDERLEVIDADSEGLSAEEEGSKGILGDVEKIPRTIAFTVLAFTQMFEVMGIHAGDRISFFRGGFKGNHFLLWAVLSTFALQLAVIYIPFFQTTFETTALSVTELAISFALASVILFAVEFEKYYRRNFIKEKAS